MQHGVRFTNAPAAYTENDRTRRAFEPMRRIVFAERSEARRPARPNGSTVLT